MSDPIQSNKWIHVVAAVIFNQQNQLLIAKRLAHLHQGGLWEFPGGKVEQGESAVTALQRELKEELNISVRSSQPFLQIRHTYPDKFIFLDIYKVTEFFGEPQGNEGQEVRWISLSEVDNFEFPKANINIIQALKIPELMSICHAKFDAAFCFSVLMEDKLKKMLSLNIDALLLRLPLLSDSEYVDCFTHISKLLNSLSPNKKVKLFINRAHLLNDLISCDGVHLNSQQLLQSDVRTVPLNFLLSASCHNENELLHAKKIGCDFVLLSPVLATQSHPQAQPLGWQEFKVLVENTELPVLALGGLQTSHLIRAKSVGAFGVAGISGFGMAI